MTSKSGWKMSDNKHVESGLKCKKSFVGGLQIEKPTLDDIPETFDCPTCFEHFVQSGYLNKPSDIIRKELVVDYPFRKLIPFSSRSADFHLFSASTLSSCESLQSARLTFRKLRFGILPFDTWSPANHQTPLFESHRISNVKQVATVTGDRLVPFVTSAKYLP